MENRLIFLTHLLFFLIRKEKKGNQVGLGQVNLLDKGPPFFFWKNITEPVGIGT